MLTIFEFIWLLECLLSRNNLAYLEYNKYSNNTQKAASYYAAGHIYAVGTIL